MTRKLLVPFMALCMMLVSVEMCCPGEVMAKKRRLPVEVDQPEMDREWGFGIILVNPTGISAKYWQDESVAWDFALGQQWNAPGVGVHADYLYHLYVFEDMPEAPIYVGGGVFLGGSGDYFTTGGRGVVGWTFLFEQPFDVFMELSPSLSVMPEFDFGFSFSVGARLYI